MDTPLQCWFYKEGLYNYFQSKMCDDIKDNNVVLLDLTYLKTEKLT